MRVDKHINKTILAMSWSSLKSGDEYMDDELKEVLSLCI